MDEVDDALVQIACDAYYADTDPGVERPLSYPMKLAIEAVLAALAERSLRG